MHHAQRIQGGEKGNWKNTDYWNFSELQMSATVAKFALEVVITTLQVPGETGLLLLSPLMAMSVSVEVV